MALKARYTVVDGEVIAEKRSGVRHQLVPDPLGSTIALLDNTQTQTDTFTYWPYGEEQSRTGTTLTPLRFVGTLGYYRDSSSRSYVRARTYGSGIARFFSQVWLTEQLGGEHPYGYALNNPITYTDPAGLNPNPGIGQRQCPGKDAYDLLLKTIRGNKACENAISQICPKGASKELSSKGLGSITFIVLDVCDEKNPKAVCATHAKWRHRGNSWTCTPTDICFNTSTCSQSVGQRAGDLLFELINYCNCKYKNAPPDKKFEAPAEHVIAVCKVPGDNGAGGGGVH